MVCERMPWCSVQGPLAFSSPEAAILVVSATDRYLLQGPKQEVRESRTSSFCAQPQKFETITLTIGYKNGQLLRLRVTLAPARGLDAWRWPSILVPRAHDPFGLRQGSRPLAGTEAGSPRITDFRLLRSLRNLNNNGYYRLQKWAAIALARYLAPARGLDPWRRPKGSWALGTRMLAERIAALGTRMGPFDVHAEDMRSSLVRLNSCHLLLFPLSNAPLNSKLQHPPPGI